jgi:hypothetical protein
MSNILQVAIPTGQPALIWPARSDPTVNSLLFINQDINNTVWLGQTSTVTAGGVNSIPILPNGTFSGDAASAWYVVGNVAGTSPLVMVPNGQAYFLGLTQGLGKLVIPQIQSPNFVTGISGWIISKNGSAEFNNVVIRGGEVINGTTFQYSGTAPAVNTLIFSESNTSGKDLAGNWYLAGTVNYGPDTLDGAGYIALQQFQGTTSVYYAPSTMQGASSPWTIKVATLWSVATGYVIQNTGGVLEIEGNPIELVSASTTAPIVKSGQGLTGVIPISQSDSTSITNPGSSTSQVVLTNTWTIPANDAIVNTSYELEAGGVGTIANVADSLTFQFNVFGFTFTTAIAAGTIPVAVFNWYARGKFTLSGTGTNTGYNFRGEIIVSWGSLTTTNLSQALRSTASSGANTQASHSFTLGAAFPVITTTPSITCDGSSFTRSGA